MLVGGWWIIFWPNEMNVGDKSISRKVVHYFTANNAFHAFTDNTSQTYRSVTFNKLWSPFLKRVVIVASFQSWGVFLHPGNFKITTAVVWLNVGPTFSNGIDEIHWNLVTCFFRAPQAWWTPFFKDDHICKRAKKSTFVIQFRRETSCSVTKTL